jgi:heterodisulfide reductase subunit B
MSYVYYPGCSLTGSARECEESIQSVMGVLGVKWTEL